MENFIKVLKFSPSRRDDDVVDQLSYLYTSSLLLAFSVLISFKQFGGRPIECAVPSKMPVSWEQYVENYCWAENSYFVDPKLDVELVPLDQRDEDSRALSYYQWIPFLLLFQAFCFRLPSIFWSFVNTRSGISIHEISQRASAAKNLDETARTNTLNSLVLHISKVLHFRRQKSQKKKAGALKKIDETSIFTSVTFGYLLTKVLYLVNVGIQFRFMNWFLYGDKSGFDVVYGILSGIPWETSGFFPRVTICDFTIRQVATIPKYSVQCILVINMFNEKIFVLLWFWYVVVWACTFASFLYWLVMILAVNGRNFVKSRLELGDSEFDSKTQKQQLTRFVKDYLKHDGLFVLRMVSMHAGNMFATDLVTSLYKVFEKNNGYI